MFTSPATAVKENKTVLDTNKTKMAPEIMIEQLYLERKKIERKYTVN